jgi:hypothetical protein
VRAYEKLEPPGGSFVDPTFQDPSMLAPKIEGAYVTAALVLPFVFQIVRATFISLGPSARLHFPVSEGERSIEFGLSAGTGRYF